MQRSSLALASLLLLVGLTFAATAPVRAGQAAPAAAGPLVRRSPGAGGELATRGEYLVRTGLCHDCHTPHKIGPKGPEPDLTRALSGHPSDMRITRRR